MTTTSVRVGALAKQFCGKSLPLQVLKSAAGWYIGTADEEGPCSRESVEYWSTQASADEALASGAWNQKPNP